VSGRLGSVPDYTGWGEPDGLVSDDLLPLRDLVWWLARRAAKTAAVTVVGVVVAYAWLRWASGQIQ